MTKEAAKILIVAADPSERSWIVRQLGDAFEFLETDTCRLAMELLRSSPIALVLIDDSLSDGNGIRLTERLRSQAAYQHIPIFLMASAEKEDLVAEAFEVGATDFILKPCNPKFLRARVLAALRSHAKIQRLENLAQEAQIETCRDALTGLANRITLEEQAISELAKAYRHQQPVSLLVVDLDRFKQLNDQYGHLAGDAALRWLGQILRERVRLYDLVVRYGGDEFVVLLPDTMPEQADKIARDLSRMIASEPMLWEGKSIAVRASVGVATVSPSPGGRQELKETFAKLFQTADNHLYEIKENRKNVVC